MIFPLDLEHSDSCQDQFWSPASSRSLRVLEVNVLPSSVHAVWHRITVISL